MKHPKNKIYANVNLNNYVKVKLTKFGLDVLIKHYNKYGITAFLKKEIEDMGKDGEHKFQLWDFMQIFGEHLYLGAENVVESNNMKIFLD